MDNSIDNVQKRKDSEYIDISTWLHEEEINTEQIQPVHQDNLQKNFVEKIKERNTTTDISGLKLSGGEPVELPEVQGRKSFQEMSANAEKRKEYLKNGQPLTKEMEREYIREYREEGRQREEKSEKDVLLEANYALLSGGLQPLYVQMKSEEEGSESFERMRTTLNDFVYLMNHYDSETIKAEDFAEHFEQTKKAAESYLDAHKKRRWTDSGERRKNLAAQIRNLLKNSEDKYVGQIFVAKQHRMKERGLEEEFNEQAEILETLLFDGQEMPVIHDEDINRIMESGSMEEKLHLWMIAERYNNYNGKYTVEFKKRGYGFDEDYIGGIEDRMTNWLKNAPLKEKVQFIEVISMAQKAGYDAMRKKYDEYVNGDTKGLEPQAFAYVKMESSNIINQIDALTGVLRYISLSGALELDGKAEYMLPIQEVHHQYPDYETVKDIYQKVVVDRAVQSKKTLGPAYQALVSEEKTEHVEQMINSGLMTRKNGKKCYKPHIQRLMNDAKDIANYLEVVPEVMRNIEAAQQCISELNETLQELRADEESASNSFEDMRDCLGELLEMKHSGNVENYADAYDFAMKASKKYLDSHPGHRSSDKGSRRQAAAERIYNLLKLKKNQYMSDLIDSKIEQIEAVGLDEKQVQDTENIFFTDERQPLAITEEQVRETAEHGSIEEKLRLYFRLQQCVGFKVEYVNALSDRGYQIQITSLAEILETSIAQSTMREKIRCMNLLSCLEKINLDYFFRKHHEYSQPGGENPDADAIARLKVREKCYGRIKALHFILENLGHAEMVSDFDIQKFLGIIGNVDAKYLDNEEKENLYRDIIPNEAESSEKKLGKNAKTLIRELKQENFKEMVKAGLPVVKENGEPVSRDELLGQTENIVNQVVG